MHPARDSVYGRLDVLVRMVKGVRGKERKRMKKQAKEKRRMNIGYQWKVEERMHM